MHWWACYHCRKLRIDPAGDPLRNHVKHTTKLSCQREGRWSVNLLKSGASDRGLFPWFWLPHVSRLKRLSSLPWLWRKFQGNNSDRYSEWKGSGTVQHNWWHRFGWRVVAQDTTKNLAWYMYMCILITEQLFY